jgi:2-haloacid dehalogenase
VPIRDEIVHSAPSTVVFDVGNVLIVWDRALLYRPLVAGEEELARFLGEVFTMEANARLDAGQPLHEFCASLAAEHPAHAELVGVLAERWIETLGPVIDGSVALLRRLRAQGTRVLGLTNFNHETWALTVERHPFLTELDGCVVSGHEGVVKPDPAIFELLCDRYDVDPEDAVFIDDSPANVASAVSLGFHGVVFDSPVALEAELVRLGVLAG